MMLIINSLLVVALILAPIGLAGVTLNLIDRAARLHRQPVKILLVDFFSLIFMVQIPWAILLQLNTDPKNMAAVYPVVAIFSGLMLLVWWTTIATVSKAGITKVSSRAQISILVIPMTYVGSFAMVGIGVTLVNMSPDAPILALVLIEFVLAVLMVTSLVVTIRCIRQADFQTYLDAKQVSVESPFDD